MSRQQTTRRRFLPFTAAAAGAASFFFLFLFRHMSEKRKDSPPLAGSAVIKRAKQDSNDAVVTLSSERSGIKHSIIGTVRRTSSLDAPVMQLSGHQGEIFACEFDPSGEHIASASYDRQILLWNTYGESDNYGVLKGHSNAIMDVHWSRDASQLFSCSADRTVAIWDAKTGERIRKWKGHGLAVNSCQVARRGPELVVSGSDDSTIKLWDSREKEATQTLEDKYQVTSVCFSDAGDMVYSGGLDNEIKVWDLRNKAVSYTLEGHLDTITGMSLSHDGSYLLSNAMDNTVCVWNVKPFSPANRCIKVFEGAPHGFEKNLIKPCWSTNDSQIACGSADRTVVVWDVESGKILYKLPGHKGSVNGVDWHPKEPILMSCSTDKTLFLGEVKPTHP